jgi:hypothetical protein
VHSGSVPALLLKLLSDEVSASVPVFINCLLRKAVLRLPVDARQAFADQAVGRMKRSVIPANAGIQ